MEMQEFIRSAGITMTANRVSSNPHMDSNADMDHWRCTLRAGQSRMTVYFSMGYGRKGRAPEAADVLDSLASDAASIENANGFEEWAADLGYDTDSRKAERTFRTVERQTARLRSFLGESAYNTLLWNVERL